MTSPAIIHHKTKNDYLQKQQQKVAKEKSSAHKAPNSKEVEKVEVSENSKRLSAKENAKSEKESKLKTGAAPQGEKALRAAKLVAEKMAKAPILSATNLSAKAIKNIEAKNQVEIIDKPAIFFIGGLELFSLVSSDGITNMADKLPGSEHYSWTDDDEIIEQIAKRPLNQPVILVGHSLGGDSVVNIANELNTVEHGFRQVDLAITLDSVGFNNDVIPENVKVNLNFIGNSDSLFNDGANIARDNTLTRVYNELRMEGHREIDDSRNIQFKIFKAIEQSLKDAEQRISSDKVINSYMSGQKVDENFDKSALKLDRLIHS